MAKAYVSENPKIGPLAKLAGILLLVVLVVVGIAWVWFPHETKLWSRYTGGSTAPFGVRQSVPNGRPRLQVDEIVDLKSYRDRQTAMLTTYGWIDKSRGIVRIPIERAMDRLIEQGIPQRKAGP